MLKALQFALGHLIRSGSLTVIPASGQPFTVGDGTGKPVTIRLTDDGAARAMLLDPEMTVGELYTDSRLQMEQGDLADFIALAMQNNAARHTTSSGGFLPIQILASLRRLLRFFAQYNVISRSRRNVAHHYDLDGRLYELFLDSDRQYSCAYFEQPENPSRACSLAYSRGETVRFPDNELEAAQLAKKRHIAAKLLVEPGQKVLDIGCGWGGMALYLARICNASVTGITLSQEQLSVARARAADKGLQERTRFELMDYRSIDDRFDRIVSVGMFEHVGAPFYQTYFDKAAQLLKDDGVMLLHSIGRMDGPGITNPWIAKYIFPGGYIPALSEVLPAIERAGLVVTDIEILRLHYAQTLKAWRARFHAARERVIALYDERFFRMFDFYLAGSEMAFRHDGMMVFQIQLARKQEVVPLTRDYIADREAALRGREKRAAPGLSTHGFA